MHLSAMAGTVVLYSSNNVETVNGVVDQFTKENPDIKVSVVRAGTGALMQRIKAEAANPLGDIFWSGGLSTIAEFRELLAPYVSPQAGAVPEKYRGPDGLWLGTNTHVTVLMTHLRQVPGGQPPKAWADLAAPQWKGKIVIPDPERSSASFVALYGLRTLLGQEMLDRIARNAVIVGTTSAAYEGVAKGEFAVAVTMEYAAYEYVAGGMKDIRIVYPAEGTFLSPRGHGPDQGREEPCGSPPALRVPGIQGRADEGVPVRLPAPAAGGHRRQPAVRAAGAVQHPGRSAGRRPDGRGARGLHRAMAANHQRALMPLPTISRASP